MLDLAKTYKNKSKLHVATHAVILAFEAEAQGLPSSRPPRDTKNKKIPGYPEVHMVTLSLKKIPGYPGVHMVTLS